MWSHGVLHIATRTFILEGPIEGEVRMALVQPKVEGRILEW